MFKKLLQRFGLFRSDSEVMAERFRLLSTLVAHSTEPGEMIQLRRHVLSFHKRWGKNELTTQLFSRYDNRLKFVKLLVKRGYRGNDSKNSRKAT